MSQESSKLFIFMGIFVSLTLIGLIYLNNRDRLASNHYYHQAIKRCETKIARDDCVDRVEKAHPGCFQAFIETRGGDVEGYARCIGMMDVEFEGM